MGLWYLLLSFSAACEVSGFALPHAPTLMCCLATALKQQDYLIMEPLKEWAKINLACLQVSDFRYVVIVTGSWLTKVLSIIII
jgi:hypothetical protein